LLAVELQILCKQSRVYGYPPRISIETGNICNLRCPLCPTGQRDSGVDRGFITLDNFKRIVDELGGYLTLLRLYNWGEPLLNKDLLSMIHYAVERGIATTISTNLSITLKQEVARQLLEAGLTKIFVSCDGASLETYERYHIDGDFDRVISNMKLLVREKQKCPRCYTRIIWLFHIFRHNEHEVEVVKKMAEEIGVELRINKMRTDMGKEIFETARMSIERDGQWIPEDPKYCAFDMKHKEVKGQKSFCDLPWKETVINWDGSVLPCCAVFEDKYSYGDAFKGKFRDVWNDKKYIAARSELLGKDNEGDTICHICKANGFTHF
jgi:radical SAM protein with 4Fe4S-binding SPASM domain